MYLTYSEYKEMGGTLDETSFGNYEFKARAKVDWYTFGRLQKETSFPEAVRRCMYAVIDYLVAADAVLGQGDSNSGQGAGAAAVASQSNDGVSVSFNVLSAKDTVDNSEAGIASAIEQYLQGVMNSLGQKLLYRGVYPNE